MCTGVIHDLRLHTLFSCMFSHSSFTHLLVNSITLYFFGAEGKQPAQQQDNEGQGGQSG